MTIKIIATAIRVSDIGVKLARLWARRNGFKLRQWKNSPTFQVTNEIGGRHLGNLFYSDAGFTFVGTPTDEDLRKVKFYFENPAAELPPELKNLVL